MTIRKSLLGCVAFLAVAGIASADLLSDPDMSMDAGSFSSPLSQFTGFVPPNGGGILDLYNDTGKLLTSFGLTTTVKTGLTQTQVNEFLCNTGPSPFFLSCGISYNSATGALTISFSGVNPPDGDESTSGEIGEQEGIPALKAGCTDQNADSNACKGQGHFAISFNNNFSFSGDVGGWSSTASPDLFNAGPVEFTLAAPEPSALLLFATVLLGAALLARKRPTTMLRARLKARR